MKNILKKTICLFLLTTLLSSISDYQEGAPNTRYKSWEWCHQAFLTHRYDNSEENIEFLSLHLAFYLAS